MGRAGARAGCRATRAAEMDDSEGAELLMRFSNGLGGIPR